MAVQVHGVGPVSVRDIVNCIVNPFIFDSQGDSVVICEAMVFISIWIWCIWLIRVALGD